VNLKRNPEALALAVLLVLLAFVMPGDLNIVRTQRASVRLEMPLPTPPPPPPVVKLPVADSCGPELI